MDDNSWNFNTACLFVYIFLLSYERILDYTHIYCVVYSINDNFRNYRKEEKNGRRVVFFHQHDLFAGYRILGDKI